MTMDEGPGGARLSARVLMGLSCCRVSRVTGAPVPQHSGRIP
jgi:hypothetical protein